MLPEDDILKEVRSALEAGQRARAKDLLTRLLRQDKNHAEAWVWLSAAVDTTRERIYCLQEALRIDPDNQAAKRGLAMFGAQPADPRLVIPPELERRKWQVELDKPPKPPLTASPKRLALYAGAAVVVIALFSFAIFGTQLSRSKQSTPLRTIDFKPVASATSATGSPPPPTATSTPPGPTPPWNLLAEPYTPTPAYVRTPHDLIEAYSIAARAIEREEWDKALDYMIQAATSQPGTADIPYQIGELHRRAGNYGRAMDFYNQSITNNSDFAPAYLGRAQAGLSGGLIDQAAARAALETAVTLDPILPEARLELARLDLDGGQYEQALEQLQVAEMILPESPWVYLLKGQAYLALGDPTKALEEARRANQLDLTLLPVYRLKGEALQASGQWIEAIVPLEIYLRYIPSPDASAQIFMARSYAAAGEFEKAIPAINLALEVDPNDADVLLLRGDYYLELDQADLALADYRQSLRLEPNSFATGLAVGRAQLALGAYRDAYLQINKMEKFAVSDEQKAQLYYWRAQSLEKIDELDAALKDWQRLLDLPEEATPAEWREIAQQHIDALVTPTPASGSPTAAP